MVRALLVTPFAIAITAICTSAAPVTFDFAPVGNPGNAPEPLSGFGAVAYNYAISKTEVTNAQYTAFLNAVDPTGANALALYDPRWMPRHYGGIEATGATDGARYIAKPGREQNPVNYVSFLDAMRFTNWLHNGQGSGDTETGAYTISDGLSEGRSSDARFWIPSEDEWYKAAYHNASVGTAGEYFDYAVGSDTIPRSDQPSDDPAAANYFNNDGIANGFNDGFAVSGSIFHPTRTNPFTDVGAYTAALSPYGTFDQDGNVTEWIEDVDTDQPAFRRVRGGVWSTSEPHLWSRQTQSATPITENQFIGFRVATVPEPNAMLMGALAAVSQLMLRSR